MVHARAGKYPWPKPQILIRPEVNDKDSATAGAVFFFQNKAPLSQGRYTGDNSTAFVLAGPPPQVSLPRLSSVSTWSVTG